MTNALDTRCFYRISPGGGAFINSKTNELIPSTKVTLLHVAQMRKRQDWVESARRFDVSCVSNDAITPAKSVRSPFCLGSSYNRVGKLLVKKGFAKARLKGEKGIMAKLFTDDQKLKHCALRAESGTLIPVCPEAVRVGNTAPRCRLFIALYFLDWQNKCIFRIDARGRDLQSNRWYEAPLPKFLSELKQASGSYWHYASVLSLAEGPTNSDGGVFPVLHFTQPEIVDSEEGKSKLSLARRAACHFHKTLLRRA